MTVKELIKELGEFPQDQEVLIHDSENYPYIFITSVSPYLDYVLIECVGNGLIETEYNIYNESEEEENFE